MPTLATFGTAVLPVLVAHVAGASADMIFACSPPSTQPRLAVRAWSFWSWCSRTRHLFHDQLVQTKHLVVRQASKPLANLGIRHRPQIHAGEPSYIGSRDKSDLLIFEPKPSCMEHRYLQQEACMQLTCPAIQAQGRRGPPKELGEPLLHTKHARPTICAST